MLTTGMTETLKLYSVSETLSGGNATLTESLVGTVRAKRVKTRIEENIGQLRSNTNQVATYQIRYRNDVTTSWLVEVDNLTYEVLGIEPIGHKDILQLTLKAVK